MPTIGQPDNSIQEGFNQLNQAFKNIAEMQNQQEYRKQMLLMAQIRQEQVDNTMTLGRERLEYEKNKTDIVETGKNTRFDILEKGKEIRQDKKLQVMKDLQKQALDNKDMNTFNKITADIYNYSIDKSPAGLEAAERAANAIKENTNTKSSSVIPLDTKVGVESTEKEVMGIKIPFTGKPSTQIKYKDMINLLGSDKRALLAKDDADMINKLPDTDQDKAKYIKQFHATYPEIGNKLGF
jgi:hypothetical protein